MNLSRRVVQIAELIFHMLKEDYRRLGCLSDATSRCDPTLGNEIGIGIDELCSLMKGKSYGSAALAAWREDIAFASQGKMRKPVALMHHKVHARARRAVAH